jgi:hypothetical protein
VDIDQNRQGLYPADCPEPLLIIDHSVGEGKAKWIGEGLLRQLKRNPVLPQVLVVFPVIPLKAHLSQSKFKE